MVQQTFIIFGFGSWTAITVALGLALGFLALFMLARKPRYRPHSIMTPNECEFYGRLLAAFPGCQIWPQIPILSLVRPDAKEGSRTFWRGFRAISNARVDWVIVRDLVIVAIVELDDRTHDARKDARRDQILASCGYTVVRFQSRTRPSSEAIREAVWNRS
ncbi:DUF2726 domain-containing protein [Microvirga puerhi]|uniref:DUF2726 domain-containing protein n=1 Tax=Microvirga puerhi TaxID=2876078 RepID=A0ABS7VSC9_9HYPH|nr:DUF2726 domain-containing protein [Microvirga puerhi]MBZ6078467.1 DUF2726 domain-containing protein [Microvirga puerhi]